MRGVVITAIVCLCIIAVLTNLPSEKTATTWFYTHDMCAVARVNTRPATTKYILEPANCFGATRAIYVPCGGYMSATYCLDDRSNTTVTCLSRVVYSEPVICKRRITTMRRDLGVSQVYTCLARPELVAADVVDCWIYGGAVDSRPRGINALALLVLGIILIVIVLGFVIAV
jgi:hypothetical protein